MGANRTRDKQYLDMRLACTLAYISLVGRPPDTSDAFARHRVLDEVAHALAIVAPIHVNDGGKLAALDSGFLISACFIRGGATLIEPDGTEQTDLVIQRADLDAAISVLAQTAWAKALRKEQGEHAGTNERL